MRVTRSSPVNMSILRTADPKVVHEKIRSLSSQFRIINESEVVIRWNRTFIALFKDRLDAIIRDKEFNDLRNILLRLQRIVGILDENDKPGPVLVFRLSGLGMRIPGYAVDFIHRTKFGREPAVFM
ncbi:MAG: hypothetical protein BWY42_01505 [Candidatus Omnitrophica bacterium ADurb.Bin277]|nr:MAG: hypothetical protein BWY42_01505 [Candidatus Omnitrophica bacterium ADurb.Bin277]